MLQLSGFNFCYQHAQFNQNQLMSYILLRKSENLSSNVIILKCLGTNPSHANPMFAMVRNNTEKSH